MASMHSYLQPVPLPTRPRSGAWWVWGALALACGGTPTGPADFDAGPAADQIDQLLGAANESAVLQTLAVLGWELAIPVSAPSTTRHPPIATLEPGLGRTLIYSANTGAYEFDLDALDGPADGVRFHLYRIDSVTDRVAIPLDLVGRIDLRDVSTADVSSAEVRASIDDTERLVYTATASGGFALSTLVHRATGSLAVEGDPVAFDLTQRLSQAEGLEFAYRLTQGTRTIAFDADLDAVTFILRTSLRINTPTIDVEVTVEGTEQTVEGSVTSAGGEVARIAGSADAPTFTDSADRPITGDRLAGFRALFEGTTTVMTSVNDLLSPSYWTFGLRFLFEAA